MVQNIRISVIIPCYNEQRTIHEILTRVRAQRDTGIEYEVIVVDDGSKDRTIEILNAHPNLYDHLIQMPVNGGKGAAVRAGIAAAAGEYILFQDADLEYDPRDYSRLIFPVTQFNADLVMGSRFLAPQDLRVIHFTHMLGNRVITFLFNLLNRTTFSDIYTCYLLYRRQLIEPRELKTDGWQQQAEILSTVVQRARTLYEVPISYNGRTFEEGKKIRGRHVIGVISQIIARKFLPYSRPKAVEFLPIDYPTRSSEPLA